MAKINPRRAKECLRLHRFGGIKSRERLSADGASDMRNFRLLEDGSLQKRGGTLTRHTLPSVLRGSWEGEIEGEHCFFAVAGDTVYRQGSGENELLPIYYLPTSEGDVSFAFYLDRLYLMDGASMTCYLTHTGTFHTSEGYTPLYGENWHPTEMGEVKEPLNLAQNRIRIHYFNATGTTVFRLPFTAKSLDRVRVNGNYIYNYSFTPYSSTFQLPEGVAGSSVDIGVTLDEIFDRRPAFLRARIACVYKDPYHETLLTFGGSPGYTVYRSARVSGASMAASTAFYGNTDEIYIPQNGSFAVGSVQAPITALVQCGEQALVFNRRAIWAIRHTDRNTDEMQLYLLRSGIGCSAPRGAIPCGEEVAVIREDGLFLLNFPASDPDDCRIVPISEDVQGSFTDRLKRSAKLCYRPNENELWVTDPADQSGSIWVYHTQRKHWVRYDGLPVSSFFTLGGQTALAMQNGELRIYDDDLTDDSGVTVSAFYRSHFLLFDEPEGFKRSLRVCLCTDLSENVITLRLESEKESRSFRFDHTNVRAAPAFFDRRAALGRFRTLRFELTAAGWDMCRCHYLSLCAN